MSDVQDYTLDEVIVDLGRGKVAIQWSVEALQGCRKFQGFVMHMAEKFSDGEVKTIEDQCAILANMLQAGINIGIEWQQRQAINEKLQREEP